MSRRMNSIVIAALLVASTAQAGVREDWMEVVDAVAAAGAARDAGRLQSALSAIPDEDLERVYGKTDLGRLAESFMAVAEATAAVELAFEDQEMLASRSMVSRDLEDFPEAEGYPTSYLCPFHEVRTDADQTALAIDAIRIARQALNSAQIAWSGLSRECEQTVLGQNSSIACIPVDIVLFAADAVVGIAEGFVELVTYCDSAVDAAEIEGSYERLGHLHDDLESHDYLVKAQLAQHDEDIKALLGDIQETVDENQRLLNVQASRQLELLRLLITPGGQRDINPDVLTCTGDDCPDVEEVITCGDLEWPCR